MRKILLLLLGCSTFFSCNRTPKYNAESLKRDSIQRGLKTATSKYNALFQEFQMNNPNWANNKRVNEKFTATIISFLQQPGSLDSVPFKLDEVKDGGQKDYCIAILKASELKELKIFGIIDESMVDSLEIGSYYYVSPKRYYKTVYNAEKDHHGEISLGSYMFEVSSLRRIDMPFTSE